MMQPLRMMPPNRAISETPKNPILSTSTQSS